MSFIVNAMKGILDTLRSGPILPPYRNQFPPYRPPPSKDHSMNTPTPEETSATKPVNTFADSSLGLLGTARDIQKQRADDYDQPGGERSMGATVAAFNIITRRDGERALSESEGWLLMQILKDVRDRSTAQPHRDSLLDCVSYSALKGEARLREGVQVTYRDVDPDAAYKPGDWVKTANFGKAPPMKDEMYGGSGFHKGGFATPTSDAIQPTHSELINILTGFKDHYGTSPTRTLIEFVVGWKGAKISDIEPEKREKMIDLTNYIINLKAHA